MGKMIEQIALKRGHQIIAKIDLDSPPIDPQNIDVAIDFSIPDAAFDNISTCLTNGIPVISGTTGWLDRYDEAIELCKANNGAFIYASNFSLGVNIFFELNAYLADMMKNLAQYEVAMEEIHHTQKLDAPSGTAISLAEDIIERSSYEGWGDEKAAKQVIPITSRREAQIPGTHTVDYQSQVDSISIKHTAHNREGFALGAVIAAEWILDKKGVFSMKDVLNLG